MKKVIKIAGVIVGLFLAGLVYLQSQQIDNINWNKLQQVSEGALMTVVNLTLHSPAISAGDGHAVAATSASSLAMSSFGIPLTDSMSAGFTLGFIKG